MSATVDHSFGAALRRLRLASGLTQAGLAERAGLSERAINDLERDTRRLPRLDTVMRLAEALALAPDDRAQLLAAARPEAQTPALDESQPIAPAAPVMELRTPPPSPPAASLPVSASPFIGRAREVAGVCARLREPDTRLLTLTGPGGAGKTRLSLEVAATLQGEFADGARFVSLEALTDPALVLPTIAAGLGFSERADQSALERLAEALRERSMLLVLDNFEQVSAAALDIEGVIAACPGLTVLVTSRAALRLAREREYPVPPLATPDPDHRLDLPDLLACDAVALLVERASASAPGFAVTEANAEAVAALCARLEGSPLAIQLAAARVKLLPPSALLTRLDQRLALLTGGPRDAPARQRTLRATLDWSYQLLSPAQRTLLRRLSVFAGGWTLEAAEGVGAGDGVEREAILDLLGQLVDQSLVVMEEREGVARYRLLETVRQYAREALRGAGEEETLRDRHLAWFLALAEEVDAQTWLMPSPAVVPRLRPELDNFRAALEWSRRDASGQTTLLLASDLKTLWPIVGAVEEGRRVLLMALAEAGPTRTLARGRAAMAAASLSSIITDPAVGAPLVEEAIAIFEELDGAEVDLAQARVGAVRVRQWAGDPASFATIWEEALRVCRQYRDARSVSETLWMWGDLLEERGEYTRARQLLEESAALCRAANDLFMLANPLVTLARVACAEGDIQRARALASEALELRRQAPPWLLAIASISAGEVERCAGEDTAAAEFFAAGLAIFRMQKDRAGFAWARHNQGHIALGAGNGADAAAAFAEALELRARQGYMHGIASDVAGMAGARLLAGDDRAAARLFGAAEALLQRGFTVLTPADRLAYERDVAMLRVRLPASEVEAAWAEGRALTMEQAVSEALGQA